MVQPAELKNRDDFEKFEKSYSNDTNPRERVAHMAVQWGHLDLLKYGLEKESRLKDRTLRTLLQEAIENGDLEIVKYLVENHKVNIDNEGSLYRWNIISSGIINNHLNIVKYFVEEGMEKNSQPDFTYTYHKFRSLLFDAVEHERNDIINYLTEKKKVDLTWVDKEKENILYTAVRKGNLDFIKQVLDEKRVRIDINWSNDEGNTLVHLLIINFESIKNAEKILRYIISEKHANLEIPLRKQRMTPLFYAITRNLRLTIIKCMIDNGANLDKQDINGHTALHLALFGNVERGLELCEYLCKHGANVNLENVRRKTPMTIALEKLPYENRMLEACKLFLNYGVNMNSTDRRDNHFVHIAVKLNNLNFLDYLVREKQVDVNTPRETDNITPLHWAAFDFRFEICKYLIEHGAGVNLKNQRNETPFDMSLKNFFQNNQSFEKENANKVWKLLLQNGANGNWTHKQGNIAHIAATHCNRTFLDYLVRDKKIALDVPRETDGWTPLHCAIFRNDIEICRYLIEHGARVNQKNKDNETPFDMSLKSFFKNNDSLEKEKVTRVWKLLLENGANGNCTYEQGNIVHLAAPYCNRAFLDYLVHDKQMALDVSREADGWTPLHCAAFHNNIEICRYLIENGVRVNPKNYKNETPFDMSLKEDTNEFQRAENTAEVRKLLLENGANANWIDERGNKLVHIAAIQGNKRFLEYLVSKKQVDINTPRDTDGWTPLHCAVYRNDIEICKYLIEHGAGVNQKNKENNTPFDTSLKTFSVENESDETVEKATDIWKLLLENGANLNWTDKEGNKLVHIAGVRPHKRFLDYLLHDKQLDVNTPRETDGWTPLHCAAFQIKIEASSYLIQHGARVNQKDNRGETPLHIVGTKLFGDDYYSTSHRQEMIEICKLFIEHGADINSTDKAGNQLVHNAAMVYGCSLLKYLIEDKHVDINTPRKKDNWTPLHCAASKNHWETTVYLVDHGADVRAKSKRGEIPANLTSDSYLRRNYLDPDHKTRRNRRNVMNCFPKLSQNPTFYQENTDERIAGPVRREEIYSSGYDCTNQLQNFFSYLGLMMRYFVGGSTKSPRTPPGRPSSDKIYILESRMDPIAVNAVNYFANVTDA